MTQHRDGQPVVINSQMKFEELFAAVERYMARHGPPWNVSDDLTYSPFPYYNGYPQIRMSIGIARLDLLRPEVIADLRRVLKGFPGWSIVVPVIDLDDKTWPEIGLIIRAHEVIDGLRRDLFPPEHQGYFYADSRVGTADD